MHSSERGSRTFTIHNSNRGIGTSTIMQLGTLFTVSIHSLRSPFICGMDVYNNTALSVNTRVQYYEHYGFPVNTHYAGTTYYDANNIKITFEKLSILKY